MADAQYPIRVFFGHFEPHPIIANSQAQIPAAFELFDLALAASGVVSECMQNRERLFPIDRADLFLSAVGPK
jgi:hypothetical protein